MMYMIDAGSKESQNTRIPQKEIRPDLVLKVDVELSRKERETRKINSKWASSALSSS